MLRIASGFCAMQAHVLATRVFELLQGDGEGQAADVQLELLLLRAATTRSIALGCSGSCRLSSGSSRRLHETWDENEEESRRIGETLRAFETLGSVMGEGAVCNAARGGGCRGDVRLQ